MLEVLVHARIGKIPKHHVWIEAEVPEDVAIERVDIEHMPAGWDAPDAQVARRFGDQWIEEARSAALVVPSVVARAECNAVVNPAHPDAARLVVSAPQAVVWNIRLFAGGRATPPCISSPSLPEKTPPRRTYFWCPVAFGEVLARALTALRREIGSK
jgi:hypothetical protein